MLRVVTFRCAASPDRNVAGRDDQEVLRLHHGDPLLGLGLPGLDGDLLEALDGLGQVALLGFEDRGGLELGVGGRLAVGNLPASVSQAAMAWSKCFSFSKLWPIWKRIAGTRASSGFWPTNSDQAARASAKWPRSSWSAAIRS